ncbi:glycosyltransferase [Ureibacillus acetophenoni]
MQNWLIYYPIEKWLSKYTDVIITINEEDYNIAVKSFKAKKVKYMPGVGLDTTKINQIKINRNTKRNQLGIPNEAFVILSVGELNKNKNHETIIRAIASLDIPDIYYVICGEGPLKEHLINLANDLNIKDRVKLLGFRNDIFEICKTADIFAFPSYREGLGMAALEAMASGLPLITSNIHGINDYSINNKSGFSCSPNNIECFAKNILELKEDNLGRHAMGTNNILAVQKYDINNSLKTLNEIYRETMEI